MRDVDYVKLSEQYSGFLIAIGGVSITVLSIVSTLGTPSTKVCETGDVKLDLAQAKLAVLQSDRRLYLSAALIVATVCCFIGAHMMAETAAFIKYFKGKLAEELLKKSPPEGSSGESGTLEASPLVLGLGKVYKAAMVKHRHRNLAKKLSQRGSPSERSIGEGSPPEGSPPEGSPPTSRWRKAIEEVQRLFNCFKDKLSQNPPPEGSLREWTPSDAITFGTRLFLLASTTIFIAVILVLFSIVLLPAVSRDDVNNSPIYSIIFVSVGVGTLIWMIFASRFRMPTSKSLGAIVLAILIGVVWVVVLLWLPFTRKDGWLLVVTFFPIVLGTVLAFIIFAWIFKDGNNAYKRRCFKDDYKDRMPEVRRLDGYFFALAVTFSYASLVAAGIRLEALTIHV
jgi:hypothetical protein